LIPLRDENPSRTFPLVTILLLGANAAAFLYEILLPAPLLEELVFAYGAVPARFGLTRLSVAALLDAPWGTLLSSMFLHGGLLHVGGNMLYLWIFGDNVEDSMGHVRFGIFYLLCGIAAALFQIVATPSSPVPLVGASGAIAGVLGAYLLLFPHARIRTLVIFVFFARIVPIPALFVLGLWFLMQIVSAPASRGAGVAFFAHIGGFVTGMILLGLFARRRPAWMRPRP
jgi:membrane associated rhomboid family serine protease